MINCGPFIFYESVLMPALDGTDCEMLQTASAVITCIALAVATGTIAYAIRSFQTSENKLLPLALFVCAVATLFVAPFAIYWEPPMVLVAGIVLCAYASARKKANENH